jgi:hypothetical protein
MAERKRIGALALCIGLALVLLVSTAFIIHEADHDCDGEDCPICRMIAVNLRLLRTAGLAALLLTAFFSLLSVCVVSCRQDRHARLCAGTLVSWKIRLND